ncbi:MAG: hypothetical protein HZB71_14270 [Betaproteobacteria bacterium]|nr:hypothetical protein [Betaproteobacteria bacterium]
MTPSDQTRCPCGNPLPLQACCGRWLDGTPAPDAETLMRSRYTAFVLRRADYLLATWHPDTRPATLDLEETPAPKWLGLKVLRSEETGAESALVEFVARYKTGGRAYRLHESSRFQRRQGRWVYVDGDQFP